MLKKAESNKNQYKPVNGKQLSLFQILLSNIAYNVIVEIIYLVGLIAISLMQNLLPIVTLKYITAVCIFIILHILFVLLESVAQMYLTFGQTKTVINEGREYQNSCPYLLLLNILRNLEKSCDGFCLKLQCISIYNRTVREKVVL